MSTDSDDPDPEVTEWLAPARRDIAEHGYHLTYVFGDTTDLPFCYSVGVWETWSHPELLLYGLTYDDTATVMMALAQEIREGRRLSDGEIDTETFDRKVAFVNVPPERYEGRIPVTIMYYRGFDFPVLQILTPDATGHFPWEPGCDATFAARQPVLGTPPSQAG